MTNMDGLYRRAVEIATQVHRGQVDKGGKPYIEHPLTVAEQMTGTKQKIVAVLHDVMEDGDVTADDLLAEGFEKELVDAVCILTHTREIPVSYKDYIRQVKANPIARAVKIADLCHNLDLSRIPHPTDYDYERCERYKKALACLQSEE